MAYHGYIPMLKQHLSKIPHPPTLLEVGVDRGVTFLTLTAFLARVRPEFTIMGVDIMVQEQVKLMLANLDLQPKQQAFLLEENSLTLLPKIVAQGFKFDVLLIDGDHNYHTVAQELLQLEALCHPHSIVIIDDYEGRWSDKDLWYAERPGYEDNKVATAKVDTEKHGVKAAVDEFLAANPQWKSARPLNGEPIVLAREPI